MHNPNAGQDYIPNKQQRLPNWRRQPVGGVPHGIIPYPQLPHLWALGRTWVTCCCRLYSWPMTIRTKIHKTHSFGKQLVLWVKAMRKPKDNITQHCINFSNYLAAHKLVFKLWSFLYLFKISYALARWDSGSQVSSDGSKLRQRTRYSNRLGRLE